MDEEEMYILVKLCFLLLWLLNMREVDANSSIIECKAFPLLLPLLPWFKMVGKNYRECYYLRWSFAKKQVRQFPKVQNVI